MKKIVMCVWNDYDKDDRIQKKALTLSKNNKVVVKCVCKNKKPYTYKYINNNLKIQYYWFEKFFVKWFVNRLILNEYFWKNKIEKADIYDCNDPDTLYAGVLAKEKYASTIIYDSHEYWKGTRRKEWNFYYTLYSYIGNTIQYLRQEKYINKTDKIICVSASIQKILEDKYKKPTYLIPNYSQKEDFDLDYQEKLNKKQVVFVGSNFRKGAETFLNDFAEKGYKVIVIGKAKQTNPKITYTGFIPKKEYMNILKESLIGIAYMDITCNNIRYSLPNKLFEYIQAGVIPIVNFENIDSAQIIDKYHIGFAIKKEKYNIGYIIADIQRNYNKYKKNLENIRKNMKWNSIEYKLLEIYNKSEKL